MKTVLVRVSFLLLLFYATVVGAQSTNSTIIGTILDSSGGAVVGAKITATSIATKATRTGLTNSQGTYRIELVPPAAYDIQVTAPGYETSVQKNLIVPATSVVTANATLKVGKNTEIVEVSADNTLLNIDNAQLAGTISALEIQNLPISSLSAYEVALTLPGVMGVTQASFSNGVVFNVGGGRPRANNFLIEGQDNNDVSIGGQGLQLANLEAVSDVKVLTANYTAEYGRGAGSISNTLFESGTKNYHGAFWLRTKNNSLDAIDKADHFNGVTTQTKYRENYPGFKIGGPILKNKLFGFVSWQGDYYRATANLDVLNIPTTNGLATLKALAGSSPNLTRMLTAYGSAIGTINPLDQQAPIDLGPDPITGVDRGEVEIGTYQRNLGAKSDGPELDITADYIPNQKDTVRVHLFRNRFTAPIDVWNGPGQLAGFDSSQNGISYNAGISETHIFNTSLVNEVRLSYGRIGFDATLPASTTSNPLYDSPKVSVSNVNGYGIQDNVPQGRFHNTYQLQDTLSWTHGKHNVKAGTDLANIRVRDAIPFDYYGTISFSDNKAATPITPTTSFAYKGLANLIDDYGGPSTASVTQNFGSPLARPMMYSQNYFVQDTYRPTTNLSIDLGLRYEYNGAPFNTSTTPYPGIDVSQIACFPSATNSCNAKQQANFKNWGPRVGVVYSPEFFGTYKTVISSGFGVFYDVIFTNIIDNIQASAPASAAPAIYSVAADNMNRGTASWYEQFAKLNKTAGPGDTSDPILNKLRTPMTSHWNLSIQQELPWNSSLQVSYVGERGEHLYGNTFLNPYQNQYTIGAARVYPTRGTIVMRDNSVDSEYAGLWAQFDHKFSHSLLFRAAYTFGKSMDDGSEVLTDGNQSSYQFSRYPAHRGDTDWGPSAYDHRQRLVLSYTWMPPVWHADGSKKILGQAINHWAIAGVSTFQSGSPENVEVGYDVDGDGLSNDRPILGNAKAPYNTYAWDSSWNGDPSGAYYCSGPSFWYTTQPCHPVSKDSVRWIVPAFAETVTNPVGRNSIYSNGFQQWDMNIARQFSLYRNMKLDLRGEFFNIFNHGEAGVENSTLKTGILQDNWTNQGTNVFHDPAPTVTGHRNIRIMVKVSF